MGLTASLTSRLLPEIVIAHNAYSKICAYTDLCNSEISALGSIKVENNKIIVEDLYLFEQVVSGASTDISQEAVSKFLCDYIKQGKDPSKLKFWWHSHVNMDAFWSGVDVHTINGFSSDWMISMVCNKRGESKVRLDMFSPFRMYFDNMPYTVQYNNAYNADIQREIREKVKERFFPSFSQYPNATYGNRECEVVVFDEQNPMGNIPNGEGGGGRISDRKFGIGMPHSTTDPYPRPIGSSKPTTKIPAKNIPPYPDSTQISEEELPRRKESFGNKIYRIIFGERLK